MHNYCKVGNKIYHNINVGVFHAVFDIGSCFCSLIPDTVYKM